MLPLDALVWRLHALKCPQDMEESSKSFQSKLQMIQLQTFANAGFCGVGDLDLLELSTGRGLLCISFFVRLGL